jgi:hypothetical protein
MHNMAEPKQRSNESNRRTLQRILSLAVVALALLTLFAVQLNTAAPVAAQVAAPTATPTDPVWLAFSAVRDALEEKYSVDLGLVLRWDFSELEFVNGIDSCLDLEDPNTARSLYFGWRFVITPLYSARVFEGRSSFDRTIIVACDRVEAPTQTEAPQGAVDPNLPAPVAGSAAIGGFEIGGHVLGLSANTISTMQRAGMRWVKHQLRYGLGNDPGVAAGLIQSAHAAGFKVLLGIVGTPSEMGNFDSYIQSYAQFVGGVATLGADAIEVWNEPNIDREWPAASINGGNYTRLLAAAFNAIKSANGSVLVISGAPAPTGFFGSAGCGSGGCNDDVFMQQMAQAGAGSYMDCVGLHYNEGIISPNQNSGDPRGGYPTYYFGSMTARGYNPFGGKPVCYTELGFLSPEGFGDPLPGNFAWAANTSVAEHATWLAEAATNAASSGRVRLMIVWNVDFPFYTPTDPMGGYAILRPDGSCPACDTLGAVMRQ